MTRSGLLKNTTALTLMLALGLTSPASIALAQQGNGQIDCEANPDDPACERLKKGQRDGRGAGPEDRQEDGPQYGKRRGDGPTDGRNRDDRRNGDNRREQPVPDQTTTQPEAQQPAPVPEQPAAPSAAEPAPRRQQPTPPDARPRPGADEQDRQRNGDSQDKRRRPADANDAPRQPETPPAPRTAPEPATVEEPQVIVPDTITDAQRERIKRDERQRREEARKNRDETIGAAAVGAILGAVIPALGGRVVEDEGDRIIVERDGEYYVRKDDSSLLRDGDAQVTVQRLRGGRTLETIVRRNGVRIETIRDEGGYILKRTRILPDGREFVLIDNRGRDDRQRVDYDRRLPPVRVDIPRDRYIVPARRASRQEIYDTIAARPVERVDGGYTLREVRENERLRAMVRRVDLDTITFETGSAIVRQSQVPLLEDMARAILALIDDNPATVILVEGHTDAVGSELYNLALSDRRAETVARILVDYYGVPAENLVIQGYGEQFLKIDTQAAEAQNRRATIRNITQLLAAN